MKPDFALSLSFDGISLLRQSDVHWESLGEVSIEATDLAGELAVLRTKAEALAKGKLRTKIVLPAEQIRFTAIDSTLTTEEDVRAALDGLTPYAIDDLVIDCDRTGGRTHIAAVAKETLEEAEAFAVEHGFNPVAFVAVAEPYTFREEVFFGTTQSSGKILSINENVVRGAPVRPSLSKPAKPPKAAQPAIKATEAPAPLPPKSAETFTLPPDGEKETPTAAAITPSLSTQHKADLAATPPLSAALKNGEIPKPVTYVHASDKQASKTPPLIEDADAILDRTAANTVPAVGGKPKRLGLVLTAGLVIFLIAAAIWSSTSSEEGLAGWLNRSAPAELQPPNVTPDMAVAPAQGIEPPQAPVITTAVPSPGQPIVRAPQGRVLSPAEADRIYAATGVYQRAPRLPVIPRETSLDGLQKGRTLAEAMQHPFPTLARAVERLQDVPISTPNLPPPFGTRYLRDLDGNILPMTDGVLTPDGAFLIAGRPDIIPPVRPGTEIPTQEAAPQLDPNRFRLVGGRPDIIPPLRPAGLGELEESQAARTTTTEPAEEAAPEELVSNDQTDVDITPKPAVAETLPFTSEPALAEIDKLEPASGEDVAPDELIAATSPALSDPVTLETALDDNSSDTSVAETALEQLITPAFADPALADARPASRPTELVTPALVARLTGDINRPRLRPSGLVPSPEADQEAVTAALASAATATPFVGITESAVASVPRPETRPRNFSQVVARARAAAAEQPTQAAARTTAPAVSSAPTPGGVARAVTIENAIRLRSMNLVGVFGRANNRRALVRMSNGRFVQVEVGSNLDGGRVTAINDQALNYVKNGRTISLELPSG